MEFEIRPYVGVGPINFDMPREDVRRVLGGPVFSFWKSAESEAPADAFDTLGIHVHYDSRYRCEAVEFRDPQNGPTFQGLVFVGQPYREAERLVRQLDKEVHPDPSGLTSFTYGFGLYAPAYGYEPNAEVKQVIVFRRGYYD